MTKDEFEAGYATRSGVTVEWLHAMGQRAVPCECEWSGCSGWAMVDRMRDRIARLEDVATYARFFADHACHCAVINEGRGPQCAPCYLRAALAALAAYEAP